jgi:hypothetical protein
VIIGSQGYVANPYLVKMEPARIHPLKWPHGHDPRKDLRRRQSGKDPSATPRENS